MCQCKRKEKKTLSSSSISLSPRERIWSEVSGVKADISLIWLANKDNSFRLTSVSRPFVFGISLILLNDKSEINE